MNHLGIEVNIQNKPELDLDFLPIYRFNQEFLKTAQKPIGIALERDGGEMASINTFIHGTPELQEADRFYVRHLIKTMFWMKGGFRIYLTDPEMYDYIKNQVYCVGGIMEFDFHYFEDVFEHTMEFRLVDQVPVALDHSKPMGGHLDGCRIGFDAGGSDRKVSAVLEGETVFSEEVVWFPKINADPQYHYDGITSALKKAATYLPRVDAVGVSSAGVFINNRTMAASLFNKIPKDLFNEKVKDIYIRAITDTFGDIPYCIVNDGDVTALAGAMSLGDTNILGIAMGTSEAGGYVDEKGNITGWLNELAFVPVDVGPNATQDDWSLDYGVGGKYFSQDSVIKLAPKAGIELEESLSPAEKLKVVQGLMEQEDERAKAIYRSIGCYLAHSLAFYHSLYGFRHVLLLGRVMSGKGGDLLLEVCRKVLEEEYSDIYAKFSIDLPDEKFRRLGQSAAAASLPEIG